jgi:osmotically-inducible protein OsmY
MRATEGHEPLRPPVVALACLLTLGVGGCDPAPSAGSADTDVERAMQQGAHGREQVAAIAGGDPDRDAGDKPAAAVRTPDDTALSARVRSALSTDPGLKALAIDVNAMDGAVTLYGTADTRERRDRATHVVLNVAGVRSVTNHLIILRDS